MSDMPMSVIIITLNEEKTVGRLLDDLQQQTEQSFEVLVIDSNSDDNTVGIAKERGRNLEFFSVVQMQERGASLGRNTGAEHARHERLVFLDADNRIAPDFIAKARSELKKSGLKVAGGRMSTSNPALVMRVGIKSFDWGMLATQYFFPTAVGACIFSTKTVHREIGGFDTRITLCEDCDYVKRASRTYRFRMIPVFFDFDTRRLTQQGLVKTGLIYLKANVHRIFRGELTENQIRYEFGHYGE